MTATVLPFSRLHNLEQPRPRLERRADPVAVRLLEPV
jgi:hypothetical protein